MTRVRFSWYRSGRLSLAANGVAVSAMLIFGMVGCGGGESTEEEEASRTEVEQPSTPSSSSTSTYAPLPSVYSTRDPYNIGDASREIPISRTPTVPSEQTDTSFSGPLEIHDSGDPEVNTQVQNLLTIASSAQERDDFGPASNFLRQALEIERSRFAETHWRVQDILFSMRYLDELANLSPSHLATIREATRMHVGAYELASQRNYTGAIEYIERAQSLRSPIFGPKHVTSLRGRADMMQWLVLTRQFDRAEALLASTLADSLEIYGESHPETASLRWTIGLLYFSTERTNEAEVNFQQALACHRDFPSSANDYPNYLLKLGGIYESQRQHAEAEPLFQEAAAILRQINGEESPSYLNTTIYLATMYIQVKQYQKAEPILENARQALYESRLTDPLYTNVCVLLARSRVEQGDLTAAESLLSEALTIRTTLTGKQHFTYAGALYLLGDVYARGGDWERAESTLAEALERYLKLGGERTPSYVACAQRLVDVRTKTGHLEEALALCNEIIQRDELTIGVQHPFYATDLNCLARVFIAMQRFEWAQQLAEQAMAIVENNPRENVRFAESIQTLAAASLARGNTTAAEPLLVRALEIQQSELRPGNLALARTLETYAALLRATNRGAEAADMDARAHQTRGVLAGRDSGSPLR